MGYARIFRAMGMVRCERCRFAFEHAGTAGVDDAPPICRQCGGATRSLAQPAAPPDIEPRDGKTQKLAIIPEPK